MWTPISAAFLTKLLISSVWGMYKCVGTGGREQRAGDGFLEFGEDQDIYNANFCLIILYGKWDSYESEMPL